MMNQVRGTQFRDAWIHILPDEMLGYVFRFLHEIHDLNSCALTCDRWTSVCWKYLKTLKLGFGRKDSENRRKCDDKLVKRWRVSSPLIQTMSLKGCSQITRGAAAFLATFPALTELDLSCCVHVDDEFLRLLSFSTTIKTLRLDFCFGINGLSLGVMPKMHLTTLSIKGAKFLSDAFVVSAMAWFTTLEVLDVSDASPDISFLKAISNLTTLTSLNLSETKITNDKLYEIATLSELRILKLARNPQLQYSENTDTGQRYLWSIMRFPRLEKLDLEMCKNILSPEDSVFVLSDFPFLTSLNLSGIKTVDDDWFKKNISHPNLTSLTLNRTQVTSKTFLKLNAFKNLKKLSVGSCNISEKDVGIFAKILTLRDLSMEFCYEVTSKSIAPLSALPNLTKLNLFATGITDGCTLHFKEFRKLKNLSIGSCNGVTDNGVPELIRATQIKELDLSCNKRITKASVPHLLALLHLQRLHLSFCNPDILAPQQRALLCDSLGARVVF